MRFRSIAEVPLSFELAGTHYNVPVGGSIDVPDRYAYAVKHHGLPMVQDLEPKVDPPVVITVPKVAPRRG